MFWLKKFVSFWLMPLPFCLTLLVIGACFLCFTKRAKLGRLCVTLSTLLLLLFSNKAVSTALIRPLEAMYPAAPEVLHGESLPSALSRCRYVVVLGGGHGDTPGLSAANKLSNSSRGRIMEGIRLLRVIPGARLVTSGGGSPAMQSHASIVADAAISLGVDPARIDRLETPRDTEDEAQAIRQLVGDEPIALVTSAWHMRRAMGLMRKAGVQAVACPADYAARPNSGFNLVDFGWDTESLGRSTWTIYEQLGYAWVRLRGKA